MSKGRSRFNDAIAGLLALVAALAGSVSAGATTTTSGAGTIVGTIAMPYPCVCTGGSFTATAAMSLSGVAANGGAYSATWPDARTTPPGTAPTNFIGGVSYANECPLAEPVLPPLGSGGGAFTLSGGLLVVNGAVWDNATLTGNLTWQWVGPTTAEASLTGATITGGPGPGVVAVTLNLENMIVGTGAMTFTWSLPMGNCVVQNPNQTATVTVSVEQPV